MNIEKLWSYINSSMCQLYKSCNITISMLFITLIELTFIAYFWAFFGNAWVVIVNWNVTVLNILLGGILFAILFTCIAIIFGIIMWVFWEIYIFIAEKFPPIDLSIKRTLYKIVNYSVFKCKRRVKNND